ncbi:SPOR domain-containing protein [Shewanella marinintestina]|uniref:SPOR domain-containing protein n=1 Tax=Shewanella marinintestina TaxID=190305 RepID=UPI00200EA889|nr:SPOR domain-containing protein [Shewanella marinintestina]MCL1145572.1 SPOR domain-containing protein [Shewanella marinintestina]
MNLVNYRACRKAAALLVAIMSLTGCANQADIALEKQRVAEQKQLKDKIEQLEQELAEWHQMKAGLSRLIVIEGDLKLLVEQLTMLAAGGQAPVRPAPITPKATKQMPTSVSSDSIAVASSTMEVKHQISSQSSDNKVDGVQVDHMAAAESTKTEVNVPEALAIRSYASAYPGGPEQPIESNPKVLNYANKTQAEAKAARKKSGFALQLSSVDKFSRIEPTWFELNSRFGTQLARYVPRYERVLVNGKTYYRIKVGEFTQRQQALSACTSMKQSGLDCIVATSVGINLYSS